MPGYDVMVDLGEHEVEVVSHGITEEDSGKLIVYFRIKFPNGEVGNKDLYPLASEKSLQITRKTLKVFGFDIDTRNLGELQQNQTLLAGKKALAVVEEHVWNGKVSNRISWINALKTPPKKASLDLVTQKLRMAKNENQEEAL